MPGKDEVPGKHKRKRETLHQRCRSQGRRRHCNKNLRDWEKNCASVCPDMGMGVEGQTCPSASPAKGKAWGRGLSEELLSALSLFFLQLRASHGCPHSPPTSHGPSTAGCPPDLPAESCSHLPPPQVPSLTPGFFSPFSRLSYVYARIQGLFFT